MLWKFYKAISNKWEKDIKTVEDLKAYKDSFPEQSSQVHVFDPQF